MNARGTFRRALDCLVALPVGLYSSDTILFAAFGKFYLMKYYLINRIKNIRKDLK